MMKKQQKEHGATGKSGKMLESFQIVSSLRGLETMVHHLDKIAVAWKLSRGQLYEINLIIEEICMNYIEHGGGSPENSIDIQLSLEKKSFCITITDSGPEFDITTAAEPDVHIPMELRKPGGLGLYLVKHLADNISYSRTKERNIVTIQTALKPS